MNIGKYVKKYVKKFYFRVKKIDSIIFNLNQNSLMKYLQSIKNINPDKTNDLALELINIYEKLEINYPNWEKTIN